MTINKLKGMMTMKIFVLAALLPFYSFAGMPDGPPNEPPADPVTQQQDQTQAQQQTQGQAQEQSSEASSSSTSDSSASSDNSVTVSHNGVRQAPSISIGAPFPTAGCQAGLSLGSSSPGGSGLISFTFTKKECELYQLAQHYTMLGLSEAACLVLNKTKAAQRAFGNEKPVCTSQVQRSQEVGQSETRQSKPSTDLDPPDYATRKDLAEVADRVLKKAMEK